MRIVFTLLCAACALLMSVAAPATAQNAAPGGSPAGGRSSADSAAPNYARLLETAKQAATAMTEKYETLRSTIRHAASPEAARKLLDDMKSTGDAALIPYQRDSDLMSEIESLLKYIKTGREEAEEQLKKSKQEKRWLDQIEKWRQRGDNVSKLRQELINEGERGKELMKQFTEERAFIENVLKLEGVKKAEEAMESALKDLREFNANMVKVIQDAKGRDEKILGVPGS
jgi:hypothetical protein